jgi:pyruvate kinase
MRKRTKIIATLGPASNSEQRLSELFDAGVDVVRLNFSHGDAKEHRKTMERIRELARSQQRDIGILVDLQGPKIRIERFQNGAVQLKAGQAFVIDGDADPSTGSKDGVAVAYRHLARDLRAGQTLLLDDGAIVMDIESVDGSKVHCRVRNDGTLKNRKGLNVLGGGLSAGALTDADREHMRVAADGNADFVAVSFVRDASDIRQARETLRAAGSNAQIVAKIERAEAIENLEEIVIASDAVMVARGDLGVELGYAELTGLQKRILRLAQQHFKVTIVATQMMESMIHARIPTRAEVADVSNAILDGTDAVMLSAETAVGDYPVETVQAMTDICRGAERYHNPPVGRSLPQRFEHVDQAVAAAAIITAQRLEARAVIAFTESGSTAHWLSRVQSPIPIYALTRFEPSRRRVSLYRGVQPMNFDLMGLQSPDIYYHALAQLHPLQPLRDGDRVVVTKGDQKGVAGGTNAMKIITINDEVWRHVEPLLEGYA